MKDWEKGFVPGKEKPPVTPKDTGKDVTNPGGSKSLTDELEKKDRGGEEIMAIEEELKSFMREQEKFNKNFGSFVEEYTKREEHQAEGTRIKEEVKSVTAPLQEKVDQQGEVLAKLQKQLEPFGEMCNTVEECQNKIKELQKAPSEEESKEKTLDKFSAQEKYDSIKTAPSALADLDNIYAERFAEEPEYRKLALKNLSDEVFVELAKEKAIDSKLTALCKDEVCRTDVVAKIQEVEKSTGKKLL